MFPREARKTRKTSRSSLDSTQNSHVEKPPESSVSQAGQLSLVSARRSLQTGQVRGGRRVLSLGLRTPATLPFPSRTRSFERRAPPPPPTPPPARPPPPRPTTPPPPPGCD